VTGGGLFHRLFLRFLAALALAFLLLLPIIHRSQLHTLAAWRNDLRDQARWLAERVGPGTDPDALAADWAATHADLRLLLFDASGARVADTHPGTDPPDLDRLRAGRAHGHVIGSAALPGGGLLALVRPWSLTFPYGFTTEVALVLLAVLVLVALALYPLVRSLGTAFSRMTVMAREVAAGSYGQTVGIERRDELGDLIGAFDEMSRQLAESERLQTRLLHDVSHELRSPLGRIQALAETVAHHPEDTRACLEGIEQEVALLDRLVGDLLESAQLESAPLGPSFREIELRAWAEETLARLGAQARSRGIGWVTRLPEPERRATGDPQRLAQAVANLVDNAVAALDGRTDGQITVRLDLGESDWTLTVEDDGPGIPPEDLPHVFRRFYRVQEDRARHTGGVGLGLSLVRAIVESHGGEVTLESRPGAGTEVRIRVPFAAG